MCDNEFIVASKHSKTHFGYQQVDWDEKQGKVKHVFESVASNYDVMNDLMSMGLHRLWKRYTIEMSRVRKGMQVLDLAGGSGDLTQMMSKRVGNKGFIILSDINQAMLKVGRDRLIDNGITGNVNVVQANAESLPFANNKFNLVTMAFGLRNVTDKLKAIRSIYQCIKPGGKLMVLEFSKPVIKLVQPLYDAYSFSILPMLGQWIAGDGESYRYLAESIRMHPDQQGLKSLIEKAGFEDCQYHNLTAGIVALHIAYKY